MKLRHALRATLLSIAALAMAGSALGAEFSLPSGRMAADVFHDPQTADLAKAACRGDQDEIARLVSLGSDPNAAGEQRFTVLAWAIVCQSPSGVTALIKSGADPNRRLTRDLPPAFIAVDAQPAVFEALLDGGADIEASINEGSETLLMSALESGVMSDRWENYYALIRRGANIDADVGYGETIAMKAIYLGRYDKLEELIDMGYRKNLPGIVNALKLPAFTPQMAEARLRCILKLKKLGIDTSESERPIIDPQPER